MAGQLGQSPGDRKRYKIADYPKVTNRTKGRVTLWVSVRPAGYRLRTRTRMLATTNAPKTPPQFRGVAPTAARTAAGGAPDGTGRRMSRISKADGKALLAQLHHCLADFIEAAVADLREIAAIRKQAREHGLDIPEDIRQRFQEARKLATLLLAVTDGADA